jgi:hypothetical protein
MNNKLRKEGVIPTALGTLVTGLGMSVKDNKPRLGWGIAGFGLAHILLGSLDLMDDKSQRRREKHPETGNDFSRELQ